MADPPSSWLVEDASNAADQGAAKVRNHPDMKTSIRSFLVLSAIAIVLAACGTVAPSSSPSNAPTSSPPPSVAPSEAPEETEAPGPIVVGTLTIVPAAVDGPGESLAAALARDLADPVFIRGFVFKDTDGQVYFADEMTGSEQRVLVAGYPTDGPTWDLGDAAITGLQEADGVLFYEDAAIYGTITL